MPNYSPTELEAFVRQRAPEISKDIRSVAEGSNNETDLVAAIERIIEKFAGNFDVSLRLDRERTLINGRADAVYNRFVIEYEPPKSLRKELSFRHNQHAIGQVKQYMEELERIDRHRKERLAGVVLDGFFYIFVRFRDDHWHIDDPVPVDSSSTETFLRYLLSLSTELALTPENLVRDFGENTVVSRLCVSTLYKNLDKINHPRVQTLFQQWKLQFSEITGWESQSKKLNLSVIARNFGLENRSPDPLKFFYAIHTYYATFIKILAVQIAHYYLMPKVGSGLTQIASSNTKDLLAYLQKMEMGGVFADFGIKNFLEGDFFGWYLDIWDEDIDGILRRLIGDLAKYSLVTLDVDPDETRDLLKHLYQNLMPKKIRHALGEYYTPDWLADRLLTQIGFSGDPNRRVLDPACGSGTFPVLAIKRIRHYTKTKNIQPEVVLEKILENVVGFDLNPLAVISARTNYLLALGDLLLQREKVDISIPIYLADSILTPSAGQDLFSQHAFSFNTVVGEFSVPKKLVDPKCIDEFSHYLEDSVKSFASELDFQEGLLNNFPLDPTSDVAEITIALDLYKKLLDLEKKGINGIWARIIKNAFAPLFQGKFDYVIGNPPWVAWQNLPESYRDATVTYWNNYDLFDRGEVSARQISSRVQGDVSVLLFYIAIDHYLEETGRIGFVITQSIFRSVIAGRGFRKFKLPNGKRVKVIHVDDLSKLNPFEGASNLTSVIIAEGNSYTSYPVSYTVWKRKEARISIPINSRLQEVIDSTKRAHFVAKPIDPSDSLSPWAIGREKAIDIVLSIIDRSAYYKHVRKGSDTRGANGVYWLSIVSEREDGNLIIGNQPNTGRKQIDAIQKNIEADLVYPLLRGRDVQRWNAVPDLSILIPFDRENPGVAFKESKLLARYPNSFQFLEYFKDVLRSRPKFRNFDPSSDPFYDMYNIGHYIFSNYKVVWKEQASTLTAAVVGKERNKIVVPDHKLSLIPFTTANEAHYVCAMLNSVISQFIVKTYSLGTSIDTHILNYINVPIFDENNSLHVDLADLGLLAHSQALEDNKEELLQTSCQVDNISATIWEILHEDLSDIRESLQELM